MERDAGIWRGAVFGRAVAGAGRGLQSEGLRGVQLYRQPIRFEEPGSLWVTNYFFVNRKEQQILFFAATGISKSALETSQTTLSYARYNDASDADSDECHRNDVVANSMANDNG